MTPSTGARTVANRLVGFAALTATIAVAVLAFAFAFGTPQTVVFNNIPFALLICATISASSIALIAVVMPLVYRRPAPVQWAVFLPTFALAGVIGTLLAAVIVGVLGVVPLSRIMAVFAQNIRGTVPTSMVIGAVLMALEHGKARLRAAEAQLQQQRTERER